MSRRCRDGRVYARGASDDKGNFLPLLHVACAMAAAGELPVNVRVLVEGEEERAGDSVGEWVRADARGADAAIVFDSGMPDPATPAITVGLRGIVELDLDVRTAERNLHSGMFGGSVLNALHVLHRLLAEVLPGPDGRVREELREGIVPPSPAELESWKRLPPGDEALAVAGGRPVHPGAGAEYYERNGADAALDVNRIEGGERRTVVPAHAQAMVSLRLAPGQDPQRMHEVLTGLLRAALPAGRRARAARPARRAGAVRSRPARTEPRRAGAAARLRRGAGLRPQRRQHPRRRRDGGARIPGDRRRLRPARRRRARAR